MSKAIMALRLRICLWWYGSSVLSRALNRPQALDTMARRYQAPCALL
ncbi:MAG: hypothetical protein ACREPU_10725 [Rhodanobacteraceae bacterium]